ncbi:SUMF1/EgtB/PvdO family nonheme iron enzyme [Nocardia sp. NPDC051463]|uniref:formylglycine-generating enzyme family protein n=1 Tax=Nocardia sp. NPDC051463 TaxID=3154845 RepID=UPI00344C837F
MGVNTEIGMVAIPAGRVTLSDRRTRRSWSVEVESYSISRFPVTQAQYAYVTGQRPSAAHGDRMPVETVSWWDAVRFCNALSRNEGLSPAYRISAGAGAATIGAHGDSETNVGADAGADASAGAGGGPEAEAGADGDGIEWIASADGYRLPTEAEWEHACRAGTTGPRYGELDEIAWYRGNSDGRMHDVGGKRPNAFGLYDMLGNVWDWCWDVYDAEVYGAYRVLRGGGWFDEHWSCRASVRRRSHPSFRPDDVGFRVVRSVLL